MLTRLRSYGADTRSTYPGLRTSATVTAQSLLVSRQFFWVTGRQTTRDTCFYSRVWAQYGCILTMCSDRASIPQMDNFTIKVLTTPRICTHCSFSLLCPTVTSSHDTGLSEKVLHDSHNAPRGTQPWVVGREALCTHYSASLSISPGTSARYIW